MSASAKMSGSAEEEVYANLGKLTVDQLLEVYAQLGLPTLDDHQKARDGVLKLIGDFDPIFVCAETVISSNIEYVDFIVCKTLT